MGNVLQTSKDAIYLARHVGLAKPTCLGIVTTLTESGYLVRDSRDKTYRLGPSLIALGHIAQESMRVSPAAREELRRLSGTFNTTAALAAVVDDRITLLELVGPPGADVGVRVGQSYPFAPPVGLMFVLWDDDALRDWLSRAPTIPLRTDTQRLDRVIAECRTAGYLVERLTPGGRRLYALMAGMSSKLPDELRALLGELISDIGERVYLRSEAEARQRHDISVISAPVYDHHHRQAMVVSLHVGRLPLTQVNPDAINAIKQAREFGITKGGQSLAGGEGGEGGAGRKDLELH